MFIKSKSKQILFLDKESNIKIKEDSYIDIILSPALYWVKRYKVPVKSNKEALKLLPSLFEEFLPSGEYNYFGYFDNDDFVGFAYDKKVITTLLKQKGIEFSHILSFRFAQTEFDATSLPYAFDEDRVLVMQEGIVIVMPKGFVKTTKKIDLQNISLSKHIIKNFEYHNDFISTKMVFGLMIVVMTIVLFDGIAWYVTAKKSNQLEQEKEEVFHKYKLLPTMIQNSSLLKKYEKIYKKEKKLRKFFNVLFTVDLPKGVVLETLSYDQKKLHIVFLHVERSDTILKAFSSFDIQKSSLSKDQLRLDIAL